MGGAVKLHWPSIWFSVKLSGLFLLSIVVVDKIKVAAILAPLEPQPCPTLLIQARNTRSHLNISLQLSSVGCCQGLATM